MDEVCFYPRERQNSNPLSFTSGHEEVPQRIHNGTQILNNNFALPEKETKSSPKPSKRTRKLSLFSFHFNSKSDDKGKMRRSSQPANSFISPPTALMPNLNEEPNISGSFSSLDSSPSLSRKCSSVQGTVDKENAVIHDIILETLKCQFENVTEYNREVCDRLGKNVCQLVKRRVEVMKEAGSQTCKIVSVVYVGAVRDNGIQVASQALLEAEKDNFTAASYRNGHVFAVGGIIAVALDK